MLIYASKRTEHQINGEVQKHTTRMYETLNRKKSSGITSILLFLSLFMLIGVLDGHKNEIYGFVAKHKVLTNVMVALFTTN